MIYLFSPERMKIEKVEKHVTSLHHKKECVIHIINLKQGLIHGLVLKKLHRVIKFNQKAWLKTNIGMNAKLIKNAKKDFGKDFFKLMKNDVFGKTMGNVRKHIDIKLVTTEARRNYLVSEPIIVEQIFLGHLIAMKMKITRTAMNKIVYLGLSILEISKIVMYQFWCDFVKLKYAEKVKLCYKDTDSIIIYIKTEETYSDIS